MPPDTGDTRESHVEVPENTSHGIATYLPLPFAQRKGIALCLSGGGYRAALFHLGSLRRLNELGILGQVDTITSVSGGSVFVAHLAKHLISSRSHEPTQTDVIPDWETGVGAPLRAFVRSNIRTKAALARYDPRNWTLRGPVFEPLSETYSEHVTDARLDELPTSPRFVICATEMEFGSQWVFDSGNRRIGSRSVGFASPLPEDWTIARATAASSSFPGAFPPIPVSTDPDLFAHGLYRESDRRRRIARIELTDGGMYDNLGLEPVWRDHETLLVSDGGPTFTSWQSRSWLWRGLRHPVILLDQVTDLRKRWLVSNFLKGEMQGAYWGIEGSPENYELEHEPTAYSDRIIQQRIARIRIDFDAFSEAEIKVLENHGYLMADIAVQRHMRQLVRHDRPVDIPHRDWMNERLVNSELRMSDQISILGRGKRI
ncbi:MAG: patatin-like phospholipase family protein [Sphaerobacteraceae bacterium]|nr:MAG: patatin-like phospholipase family protein [Sphaerobacteraceae bacterium]